MFTPIRNLITYIQKNASSSTFFGGTSTPIIELSETTTAVTETEPVTTTTTTVPITMESEMMDKHPVNCTNMPATIISEFQPTTSLKDQNLNEITNHFSITENNLLHESKPFACTTNSYTSDPLNVQSNYNGNQYLTENDENEEEKDIFLDFPTDGENDIDFPTSEVVVLNDPDLNMSMNSDPAADPLALDDYSVNLGVSSPHPLDSSTESNVLFVVDIDDVVNKAPRLIDEVDDSRQHSLTTATTTTTTTENEQELRSDGSDSGLGSETSTLQTTANDTSVSSIVCASPLVSSTVEKIPMRSNLKRHHPDVVVDDCVNGEQLQKKPRRSINFEGVKVFYFPRIQGHGCVPSQGGCTLGMGAQHISFKTFSLAEHAAELRRAHKLQLQEINPRGSSSEESDSDEELTEGSGSDLDAETNGFLQPVSPKQRRALLKAAGIRKIDASEKIECRDIRNSREVCGCVCRDFCDPDTCACSQAGIKCQVDRAMFPCGCSRDACGNVIGRIEFNPARVRTHFIHTIMRLDMENRQQKRNDELSNQIAVGSSSATSHLVYNNVSALASSSNSNSNSSTADITTYNPMPSYSNLDQGSNEAYHHHMQHQQYNVYNHHMSQPHHAVGVGVNGPVVDGLCVQLSPQIDVMESGSPTTHNLYAHPPITTAAQPIITEPDSIGLNGGGNLHYQDGSSMYSSVMPPVVSYGDMLTSYANTAPYETTNGSYSTENVYSNYHSHEDHIQAHQQQQQPFLEYANSCNGDLPDFNESQNSFISLNTPDASSARLSAINDLLDNTRNSTAALVAVSPMQAHTLTCDIALPHDKVIDLQPAAVAVKEDVERTERVEQCADTSIRPETPPAEQPLEPPVEPPQVIQPLETNVLKEELPKMQVESSLPQHQNHEQIETNVEKEDLPKMQVENPLPQHQNHEQIETDVDKEELPKMQVENPLPQHQNHEQIETDVDKEELPKMQVENPLPQHQNHEQIVEDLKESEPPPREPHKSTECVLLFNESKDSEVNLPLKSQEENGIENSTPVTPITTNPATTPETAATPV